MLSSKPQHNSAKYPPEDFDANITKTIPYYDSFHMETINLVKSLPHRPHVWLDTGCGTGTLIHRAAEHFQNTRFLLMDPSESMLQQAKKKLSSLPARRIIFLEPSTTEGFIADIDERPDVITAIQCHHYLNQEERIKAIDVCYGLLENEGMFISFENIRPLTEKGTVIFKEYLRHFQLSLGKDPHAVQKYLDRFDTEYFPITIEEHLDLLRKAGFRTVEMFWYSYMQAGFYCIK
ncbi:MAG: class I SAM-dependent methyltransferase [Methanolobus sp.]|nr:class I SAM-dependent methyltransferase [Methanolobus sp.]